MKVQIEYTFIFDPTDTWNQFSQMDADFAAFFQAKGLEAELVKYTAQPSPQSGSPFKRILYIKKMSQDNPVIATPEPTLKQTKASLTQSRGYDGKFKK